MSTHSKVIGTKGFLQRFSFRRMLVGALVFGFFAAIESIAQGLGIVAAYPNETERAKIIYSLSNNSALGLFYGDSHTDIISPAGYMVYRISPILSLVCAIWVLMFVTKMLRGQEENGRWELFLSGQTTARATTIRTLVGTYGGLCTAYLVMVVLISIAGSRSALHVTPAQVSFFGLSLIAGGMIAVGIASLSSQLAATRRKAVFYGLLLLLTFFMMRSVGNIVESLAWLKNFTPFGWIDKLHPFAVSTQPQWLLPILLLSLLTALPGIWLSGTRDMLGSLIADSVTAKPKLRFLASQFGFAFRSTRNIILGWLAASIAFGLIITAVAKTVAKSFSSNTEIMKTFSKLSGNPSAQLELAYLGAASYLIVTVLMIFVTNALGAARDEESSGRLDNLISGDVKRMRWLGMRLSLIIIAAMIIIAVTNSCVWALAHLQSIDVSFISLVVGGQSIMGPVVFTLGLGTLLYGLRPRFAIMAMYGLLIWSFTIDIVSSALKTSQYLADTSLFRHLALVPATTPKWGAFGTFVALGMLMMALGVYAFGHRDLEAE